MPKSAGYAVHAYAARVLGVPRADLHSVTHGLDTLAHQRAAAVLAEYWATADIAAGTLSSSTTTARWTSIDRYDGGPPLRIPASATGVVVHDGGRAVVCIDEPTAFNSARTRTRSMWLLSPRRQTA